jgi:ATP-dependent protease ClpP protease subunit
MDKYKWSSSFVCNNKKRKVSKTNEDDDDEDTELNMPNIIINKQISNSIYSNINHIYFNSDIDSNSAFNLNKELRTMEIKLKTMSVSLNIKQMPIYLHLTTNGGSIHSALSIIDCMNSISVPIYTVIDGYVASAGTLISVSGAKRFIGKNAYILIHELRSGVWGKMTYLEEEFSNFMKVQEHLTNIYIDKTSITKKKLVKMLKKDIEWNAEDAINFGIADEYYN